MPASHRRGRHRAPSRPASQHPAVLGTTAAVIAVGGVAVFEHGTGSDPAVATVDARPLSVPSRAAGPSADLEAPTRASVTTEPQPLATPAPAPTPAVTSAPASTTVVPGTGRHRKPDRAPSAAAVGALLASAPPDDAAVTTTSRDAAQVPLRLRRSCGFRPGIQLLPELNDRQLRNARKIVAVGQRRGLPARAAVIALATAAQESNLRNLDYGDRDSLGLFQQRPSMGWGTPRQVRNPEYAAGKFYSALVDVRGWKRLPVTVAAQRVQRSAFPAAYAKWELLAATLVDGQLDATNRELNCAR